MVNVIIINGPSHSGKTTAIEALTATLVRALDEQVANIATSEPLKVLVNGIDDGHPSPMFTSKEDQRFAEIATFESLCRVFGDRWLGRMLTNKIRKHVSEGITTFVIECNKSTEVAEVLKLVSPSDILVLQFFRKGCSFRGDIREYIDNPQLAVEHITNNRSVTDMHEQINDAVFKFLAEKN